MSQAIIELRSLTRRYGRRRGVEGIDLDVPEGALFGFLGPNGAGKTTTIRVLLGFLHASGGTARALGRDCWRESRRIKEDVGYVPGDVRLYPWLTGRDALRIVGAVRGRGLRAKGAEIAEELGLDLSVKVRSMSRGTRQKLGLVLAMAHEPRLLILDEPTSSLDPLVQERLRSRLRRMARSGHTVFFSSHTLSEVESLCDRVAILREGRLVANETLDALRRATGHEVTVRFRDSSLPSGDDTPSGVRWDSRAGSEWRGRIEGPLEPLLAWLGKHSVDDVALGRPDLETLFRRFYSGGGGAA